jgi:hypothetical protein
LSRDLPGTGSKTGACGVSDTAEVSDFAAASRQIAGKRAPTASGQNQKLRTLFELDSARGGARNPERSLACACKA